MQYTKEIIINDKVYVPLHQACPAIGLTYSEVYHNIEVWEAALGIVIDDAHFYVMKEKADMFEEMTVGYVPFEYRAKRKPIIELDDDNVPEETIIGGTRWTRKLRNAKIRLDRIK